MRTLASSSVLLLLLTATARAGTPIAGFSDTAVVSGLSVPTAIAFLPDDRLLVTEKDGALRLVDGGIATTLITIAVCSGSEMGLLGIALDPDFGTNGYIYLYRTEAAGGCGSAAGRSNEVIRVTYGPGDTISGASQVTLLTGIRTDNGNHDGGGLRIGPDDKLYVGVGDTGLGDNIGGPGSSTNPYAQDLTALEGKMLRLELDGSPGAGNPYIGMGGGVREEIFASGFRNPWRFGFDPQTGALWVGDVGDLTVEEIDIVSSEDNHAWPHCEGLLPVACQNPGDVDPIFTYPHSGTGALGSSITGGAFAEAGFGAHAGDYFFADFGSSTVYRATPNAARDDIGTPVAFVTDAGGFFGGPVDLIFGPDGAMYYVTFSPGEIRRVAEISEGEIPVTTRKLIIVDRLSLAGNAKVVYVSKDQGAGITKGSGTDVANISAAFSFGYDSTNGAFAIPQGALAGTSGWKVNKTSVAKYINKSAPAGDTGAKVAVLKPGKLLKLVGKSLGDTPIDLLAEGEPVGPISTVFEVTNGGQTFQHCSEFDPANPAHTIVFKEIAGGTGRKLVAKKGAATACP